MKKQDKLLENTDWNFLIILDACRFDYFKEENDIEGKLTKARSNASHTYHWLQKNMRKNMKDVKLFSAHPVLNSRGITPSSWIPTRLRNMPMGKEELKYVATDFFDPEKIVDLWSDDHLLSENNLDIKKSDPREVIDSIIEIDDFLERNIIWLMDPHHPYIESPDLPEIARKRVWKEFSNGEIRRAYRKDLKITLDSLRDLLPHLDGRVIITADHGDKLDIDDFLPFHGVGITDDRVRNVPWLEVSSP